MVSGVSVCWVISRIISVIFSIVSNLRISLCIISWCRLCFISVCGICSFSV